MITLPFLLAASALPVSSPPSAPSGFRPLPECTPTEANPCVVRHDWDPEELATRMGSKDWSWWLDHDHLTVVAQLKAFPWLLLCCDVQTPLEPIPSTDLVGITVRVPDMDHAILQVIPVPLPVPAVTIRGSKAPPVLKRSLPLKGRLIVKELAFPGGGDRRSISIYLPPAKKHTTKGLPVLYLADDLASDFASIAEEQMVRGVAPRAIIVGIASAPMKLECANAECDHRSEEYLTDTITNGVASDLAYDRHKAFVLNEVIPMVERSYPVLRKRKDRCVGGVSNGASWALTMAEANPAIFGCVMAFSTGSKVAVDNANQLKATKVTVGYGKLDFKFAATTKNVAHAARSAGAQVREFSVNAGHSDIAWNYLFANSLKGLF